MTVESRHMDSSELLVCAIGGHDFRPYLLPRGPYLVMEVDGVAICFEHYLAIATSPIPESLITRYLVRKDAERRRRKAQEKLRRGDCLPGWVYYVRVGNLVKIGFTESVTKRMKAYPPNSELLATHPGTREVERDMHERFKELRARGREWFREGGVLVAHVEEVRSRYGDPAPLVRPMRHAKSRA